MFLFLFSVNSRYRIKC